MASSKNYNIKAASLVESIMAMVIVAVCLGIALVIYVNVLQSDRALPFYEAEQKVKELLWSDKGTRFLEHEDFTFPTYTIQKEVSKMEGIEAYHIKFTVRLPNDEKIYEYVVLQ
ncbi:hypothetical protein LDL77_19170 [Flagellimonas marinaquae]|uniref:hypothetical protein n=1 Tax=Flagellimonas aurea TaxID=2915619 RepID=UPI000C8D2DA7|nr:hypothetical protein [Allomuricauda sp.]UBZ13988.1 hypothetical protein LDL77_19170 [Allomuricauda aquimarina]|tara:strand:- start:217 stop:558 length:342 start_codon:yes stop_codon:yes gene_type:complete